MKRSFFCAAFLIFALFLCSGCIVLGLGTKCKTPVVREPTMGEELRDLKEALDDESITVEEYERAKARVLKLEEE